MLRQQPLLTSLSLLFLLLLLLLTTSSAAPIVASSAAPIGTSSAAAPIVTQRPTFRIDGTERVLFIYTGNLIVSLVCLVALARVLTACFGLCCVGNQERFYYREVLNHVFSLSERDKERREPVDSIVSAMRYAEEFLQDREARCLAALSHHAFKAPAAAANL